MDIEHMINKDGKLLTIRPIDKICEELTAKFTFQNDVIEKLRIENSRLKSEAYKDEELTKMKEAYERMHDAYVLGFPITLEEHKVINAWIEGHEVEHPVSHTAIGGRYTYEFIPTSIGVIGSIRCICGKSLTFTKENDL